MIALSNKRKVLIAGIWKRIVPQSVSLLIIAITKSQGWIITLRKSECSCS